MTPTLISYLHLCHRKLWLHHHGIRMEHNSDAVAEGKLIGETSYSRRPQKWKELSLDGAKIDHFDPQTNTIREIKKSPKLEHAHVAQVKYYLWLLEQRGLPEAKGIIEYPKLKKNVTVTLTDVDRANIKGWIQKVEEIIARPVCPELIPKSYCKSCSFQDFCFV
jgi:CRISPR-associated exonuclease Cas4